MEWLVVVALIFLVALGVGLVYWRRYSESINLKKASLTSEELARDEAAGDIARGQPMAVSHEARDLKEEVVEPHTFYLGAPESPFMTVSRFAGRPDQLREVHLGREKLSRLAGALQPAVTALAGGSVERIGDGQTQLYAIKLTSEAAHEALTKAADGDGLRTFVQGADGRILENARAYNVDAIRAGAAAIAVWQIAALVTSQKYLAEISAKLASIDRKLDEVLDRFEMEDAARLTTCWLTVKDIAHVVDKTPQGSEQCRQHFSQLTECGKTCDELRIIALAKIKAAKERYAKDERDTVGSELAFKAINIALDRVSAVIHFVYMADRVKLASLQLLLAISDHKPAIIAKIEEIESQISQYEELISSLVSSVKDEITMLDTTKLNFRSTLEERKMVSNKKMTSLSMDVAELQRSAHLAHTKLLAHARTVMAECDGMAPLLVKVDGNNLPVAIYEALEVA